MKLAAIINTGTGSSSSSGFFFFFDSIASSPSRSRSRSRSQHQRYRRWGPVVVSSSSRAAEQELYTVLGISPNASSSDVKRAYRLLARKVSPTLTPTPQMPYSTISISFLFTYHVCLEDLSKLINFLYIYFQSFFFSSSNYKIMISL